eukprot:8219000-Alexandrium_andersonii.AAC.1
MSGSLERVCKLHSGPLICMAKTQSPDESGALGAVIRESARSAEGRDVRRDPTNTTQHRLMRCMVWCVPPLPRSRGSETGTGNWEEGKRGPAD